MASGAVGVLGATSLVGRCLLTQAEETGLKVIAFTRQNDNRTLSPFIEWRHPPALSTGDTIFDHPVKYWICLAPIWVLGEYFHAIEASGAKRVVALSSTSRFTKLDSDNKSENETVQRLIEGESALEHWAKDRGIEWVILRPTMIYGLGIDKNVSEIARFIRRFRFFPLFGKANGMRQPIHACDVASVCISAVTATHAVNRSYNISGGETLAYRDLVARIFVALEHHVMMPTVPLWAFRITATILRTLPRYRQWSVNMAERMNRDLVFDHADATRDLGFQPRAFSISKEDLPG